MAFMPLRLPGHRDESVEPGKHAPKFVGSSAGGAAQAARVWRKCPLPYTDIPPHISGVKKRVVIIGGGFGGLETAKALRGADLDITLVDRTNHHLFQPLLYQVAMAGLSPAEIAMPIRSIFAEQENLRVLLAEVTGIDLAAKRIDLSVDAHTPGEASSLSYDFLVLATGAKTSYFGKDQWERHAPGLKSIDDAIDIRNRVLFAFERAERTTDEAERKRLLTFVVIGGGPTGVELAGAIAELAQFTLSGDFRAIRPGEAKVVLVEAGPRLLASFTTDLSQSAKEQLEDLGVRVVTGVRVTDINERGVEIGGNELIEARVVVWGAGVGGTRLLTTLGVPLDRQGRVQVGPDCAVPHHPEAFVIGDAAHFDDHGKPLPGVSPVAMQQGRYVAQVIVDEVHGDPRRPPFKYWDKGSMATIGRKRAVAQAGRAKMSGFLAWMAWLFIHLLYLVGFRNRFVVLFTWAWSYVSYKRGARLITDRVPAERLASEAQGPGPQAPARTVAAVKPAPTTVEA